LARNKVEKELEEKCKHLQTTLQDKKLTEQRLAELQLLMKKVGHISCCCMFKKSNFISSH